VKINSGKKKLKPVAVVITIRLFKTCSDCNGEQSVLTPYFCVSSNPLYQPLYDEYRAISKRTEHKNNTFIPKCCSSRDIVSSLSIPGVFVFVGFYFRFYWFAHHISRLHGHPVYSGRLQAGCSVSIRRLLAHCHVQKEFDPITLPVNGDFRLSQRIIVDHSHVTKAQMMNAWSSFSTPPTHIYGTVTRTETTFHKILYVSKMLKISIWLLQRSSYNCAILRFWK